MRRWTPLPETADELCEVGRRLGVPESEILIGVRATESAIKDLSDKGRLAQFQIVHFATHGALTGQVQGTAEPGLILTPPPAGTNDIRVLDRDDGFLAGSEIATLKLDADWVILSACNTAGAQNENAEALSGMARAFFYAGARALLVSHWEVGSEAAVKLTTGTFAQLKALPEHGSRRGVPPGHARAHRKGLAGRGASFAVGALRGGRRGRALSSASGTSRRGSVGASPPCLESGPRSPVLTTRCAKGPKRRG